MKHIYWVIGLVIIAVLVFGKSGSNPFTLFITDVNFDGHVVSVTSDSDGNVELTKTDQLSYRITGSQERNAIKRGGSGYVKMVFEDVSKYDSFSLDLSMSASVSGDERADARSSSSITVGSYTCIQEADLAHSINNNILQITQLKDGIYEVITSCGKQVISSAGSLKPELRIESSLTGSPYAHAASSSISVTGINVQSAAVPIEPPVSPEPSILDSLEKLIKAIIAFILIPFVPPF